MRPRAPNRLHSTHIIVRGHTNAIVRVFGTKLSHRVFLIIMAIELQYQVKLLWSIWIYVTDSVHSSAGRVLNGRFYGPIISLAMEGFKMYTKNLIPFLVPFLFPLGKLMR